MAVQINTRRNECAPNLFEKLFGGERVAQELKCHPLLLGRPAQQRNNLPGNLRE